MGALLRIGAVGAIALFGVTTAKSAGEEVGERIGGSILPMLLVGAVALILVQRVVR